jgi:hypothetical protein
MAGFIKNEPAATAVVTVLGLIGIIWYDAYITRKLGSDA